ncbi:hypothetical protein [Alicyclobacillus suci]|uniref:hypothetical protein n=1 Tax=Alicyclobacillus suci TaxID=2816080 RepID=UPI001A8CF612|nr:hypothetical protein [Alicyclobacillus suci]
MSEVKTFRIIPDRAVDNKRGHEFTRALHDYMFKPWHKRLRVRDARLERLGTVWYVMRLTAKEITFHLAAAEEYETFIKQRLGRYWERAAVMDEELPKMKPLHTAAAELNYTRHNIFALAADWRQDTIPIASILNVARDMREGDEARVLIALTPYSRKAWQDWSDRAWDEFKKGRTPHRSVGGRFNIKQLAVGLDGQIQGMSDLAGTIFDGSIAKEIDLKRKQRHKPDYEKREIMQDGRLGRETTQKRNEPVFRTHIFVLSHSDDMNRRQITLRALSNAFTELSGDNELKRKEYGRASIRIVDMLNRWEVTSRATDNLMSCSETGKLFQLPTASLQDEYAQFMTTIERRETGMSEKLLKAKIIMGSISFKGETREWGLPISDWDELCLPRAVIGGMGTGKTSGFGGNFGARALANGFSVFSIDVAKDELGEEIDIGARALGVPEEKLIHLHFGERAIRLDWREGMRGKRAANRLAGEVLNFFNLHGHEAGVETARLLRLAAKTIGMIGGSLYDMMLLFTYKGYRGETADTIRQQRPDLYDEWQAFERLSDGMKGKVLEPVLNRLDMLLGDDYLRECFRCADGIDFTQYMTGGYHIRIYVPKRDLGAETTDILVDFLMSKIELAMFARAEEDQVPAFVIADEPHQFRSCAPRWERMTVESRKWRVGLIFMFHLWDQVPKTLTNSIKAAGAHFTIYTTSKQILKDLAEEIDPFTVEEALKTPRHYAINVIRSGGETITPFMAKMSAPPSKWKLKEPKQEEVG